MQAARTPGPRALALPFVLLAGALVVRIAGAQGELWLDEIWSLRLIDQMKAGDALPAIATDNNHYLNTLFMALVGGDAAPLPLRALSVLLGTMAVAAAGWLQRERGGFSVVATMALFAFAYPLVNAGSEARGYAGMLLCALIAIDATERRNPLALGIAAAVGVLFQPMMLGMIAALGLWVAWQSWRAGAGPRGAIATVATRFVWTVRLLIPLVAVIGVAVYFGGRGYSLGGVFPFDTERMLNGIARLFRFLLGLPEAVPGSAVVILVLAIVALALLLRGREDPRLSLYLITMLVMPAVMALAHLPNSHIPRYYLLPGLTFLLLLGDLLGALWARGGVARGTALLASLAILIGNALELRTFLQVGRGDVTGMLKTVVADGMGPITSNSELRDRAVLDYFLKRMRIDVPLVAYQQVCENPPRWILTSDWSGNLPQHVMIGGTACHLAFKMVAQHPSWGLSGLPWTLYRAE